MSAAHQRLRVLAGRYVLARVTEVRTVAIEGRSARARARAGRGCGDAVELLRRAGRQVTL